FGSFIATYMVYKGASVVGPFPTDILDIPLTSISTFVLLMSSLAVVVGLDGIQKNNRRQALAGLFTTVTLGALFLGFQAYAFTYLYPAGRTPTTYLFGSSSFILTVFHGAHVSIGIIWLSILFMGILRGPMVPEKHALQVEVAGLYWHFVDIVWIVIFTLIY